MRIKNPTQHTYQDYCCRIHKPFDKCRNSLRIHDARRSSKIRTRSVIYAQQVFELKSATNTEPFTETSRPFRSLSNEPLRTNGMHFTHTNSGWGRIFVHETHSNIFAPLEKPCLHFYQAHQVESGRTRVYSKHASPLTDVAPAKPQPHESAALFGVGYVLE